MYTYVQTERFFLYKNIDTGAELLEMLDSVTEVQFFERQCIAAFFFGIAHL